MLKREKIINNEYEWTANNINDQLMNWQFDNY